MPRNKINLYRAKRLRTNPPKFALEAAERATAEALAKRRPAALPTIDIDDAATNPKPDRIMPREVTDELVERLERRQAKIDEQLARRIEADTLNSKWSHKQGTPETLERINRVPRRQRQSPLVRMYHAGKISIDELAAAEQIVSVIEMIQRAVSPKTSNLEARVDCSGAAKDVLVEGLNRIRMETAYRLWRDQLPEPRQMILEMIQTNQPYTEQARKFRVNWRTARKRLITSLQNWIFIFEETQKSVSAADVLDIYWKLGEGVLLAPPPKKKPR